VDLLFTFVGHDERIKMELQMQNRRVVVTGIGAITPLGLNVEDSFAKLIRGVSGVAATTHFDVSTFDSKISAEVKGFNPENYFPAKEIKRMDRYIQFALVASAAALKDSGLVLTDELKAKTGVFIGTSVGGIPQLEREIINCHEKGPKSVSTFFVPMVITNMAAGNVSVAYGLKGPSYSISSACASGLHSIGEAANYIRAGMAEVMFAGATDAAISPVSVAGFSALRALSTRNDDPQAASRPFDRGRDGFVLGEGAGVLILESLDSALLRGAKIYGEITGFGLSSDGSHIVSPSKTGEGAYTAMNMALTTAGLAPIDIPYISVHGTSTPAGDPLECLAVQRSFGDHAKNLCVSSMKSMIGHTVGASGAIESAFSLLAIRDSIVPPTINLNDQDPECNLDCVANVARSMELKHVMKNSFGFGGTNASVIFSKFE
jgi:3-oxoacyl-[acyl-carrier-protein] synthase II